MRIFSHIAGLPARHVACVFVLLLLQQLGAEVGRVDRRAGRRRLEHCRQHPRLGGAAAPRANAY